MGELELVERVKRLDSATMRPLFVMRFAQAKLDKRPEIGTPAARTAWISQVQAAAAEVAQAVKDF